MFNKLRLVRQGAFADQSLILILVGSTNSMAKELLHASSKKNWKNVKLLNQDKYKFKKTRQDIDKEVYFLGPFKFRQTAPQGQPFSKNLSYKTKTNIDLKFASKTINLRMKKKCINRKLYFLEPFKSSSSNFLQFCKIAFGWHLFIMKPKKNTK